jgi:hypothetical protein
MTSRPRFLLALALASALAAPALAEDRPMTPPRFAAEQALVDSIRFAVKVADANLMGVTLTNYGFIGNNFVSRSPSMEYPLGTGYEHLVRGGLWVGAQALDDEGTFTGVVTGAVDGSQGTASQSATEFTPAGLEIKVRSSLQNSRFFDPRSISEQDYLCEYSDRPAKRAQGSDEDHRPISVLVRQENYSWSFSEYQHILFFHWVIKNQGPPLQDAWVGFYAEFASGPKNAYSVWPPSSTGSALGSWYRKKWVEYEDSLRLVREHYCLSAPIPGSCDLLQVPYWVGVKLLGVSPGDVANPADKQITLGVWNYLPGGDARDEDVERYALLSAGTQGPWSTDSLLPPEGDPVTLLAVGPFTIINPGDSIAVDFALVGGAEIADIQNVARFAQRAFDRDYVVPIPPPSPRLHVEARNGALDLYWDDSPESATDPTSPLPQDFEGYRVYVGEDRLDLRRAAQFDKATPPNDTTGFNTGFDAVRLATPAVFDGVPYPYKHTIPALRNGFKYFVAVTSFDLGSSEIESLESGIAQNKTLAIPAPAPGERAGRKVTVFPNPYRVEARWDQGTKVRDHYLWFANLPERCRLKIFTLSGDLVFETEFDGSTYRGQGARGIYDPSRELDVDAPTLSGATFGWDMISREGQAVASGLYLFAVEDAATGEREVGKFLIVKSDREEF